MILTSGQEQFLMAVHDGKNVFLTGKAGTGKSTAVRQAVDMLKEWGIKCLLLAPTGVAANNIDGATLHSTFQLPVGGVLTYDDCRYMKSEKRRVLDCATCYLIDEVSMIRPDTLDAVHWTLKKNGLPGLDERQIIFVGDLKQLPPVINDNTRAVLYKHYTGETFQDAKIYKRLRVETIELTEVRRQSDSEFLDALNIVRDGGRSEYFRRFLHTEPLGVILAPYNATVAQYNNRGLMAQEGDIYTFTAEINGTAKETDFALEAEIHVKHGCKIMYLVNSRDSILRNGTLGEFIVKEDNYFIKVDGVEYKLSPIEQLKKEYVYDEEADDVVLQEVGSIYQYPFKLAYALTIHKSQGLTFDQMTVDLSQPCRTPGMVYVALSRVRTPDGLRIICNRI